MPTQSRSVILRSSGLACSTVAVIGSRAIPQMGQFPGLSRTISGCMGHVYREWVRGALTVSGSKAIPHFGQLPAPLLWISGCMGQTNSVIFRLCSSRSFRSVSFRSHHCSIRGVFYAELAQGSLQEERIASAPISLSSGRDRRTAKIVSSATSMSATPSAVQLESILLDRNLPK